MTNIIIFGNRENSTQFGRFSQAIVSASKNNPEVKIFNYSDTKNIPVPDVVIYSSRSVNQLDDAVKVCNKYQIPMLILSTDILEELNNLDIDYEYCPNSSSKTIKFIENIKNFYSTYPNWNVDEFIEWHQESKQSLSGTAKYIAKSIGYDVSKIVMIRDDELAKSELMIPSKETGFAMHQIKFVNSTSTKEKLFKLITIGRNDYAKGAIDKAIELSKKFKPI